MKRGIMFELRVDDYHACGGREQLEEPQCKIDQRMVVKEWAICGPDDREEYERLQRRRLMRHDGTWVAPSPQHITEM